ncbi:MAG: bifunctional DNA primase/polymerase [Chloroflexota bacterium]
MDSPATPLPKLNLLDAATAPTIKAAAHGYLDAGFNPLPIPKGQKHPDIEGWQNIRTTHDLIDLWYANPKYVGVSIRPGALGDNTLILDFDDRLSYEAFCAAFPALIETHTERSGSGKGWHKFYRVKRLPQISTSKLKREIVVDGQKTHIELFWDSGQIVVAPSLHPSGNYYTVEKALPVLELDNLDDVIEWIYSLAPEDERATAPTEPQRQAIPTKPGAHTLYAQKALDGMSADVARLTSVENDFQNDTCYKAVWKGAHYVARGDATEADLKQRFQSAMQDNGYIGAFGYTKFKKTFESAFNSGFHDNAYVPKCYQEKPKHERRNVLRTTTARIPVVAQHAPELPYEPPAPLTMWQAGRYMCVCPEYVVIHRLIVHDNLAADFTAAQLAESAWVSPTTAQKWIDATLRWRLISELTANFQGIEDNPPIPGKNAVNSTRGRKAVHYRLTPALADGMIHKALPDHVQELMEAPDPGVIYGEESEAAGVVDSGALETVSSASAATLDALEVTARAERAASRKAAEIEQRAELDMTPLPADELHCSVRATRTLLIETLWATDPTRVWTHGEYMWVAGTKKGNVSKLIAKSDKIMPAASPTFVSVTFANGNAHAAMQAACRAEHGAPAAWLDGNGEVISGFGRTVPADAAGGLINVGKVYVRRESAGSAWTPPEEKAKQEELPMQEPTEEAKLKAKQARARSVILPRLKGCLLAQGWKYIPGPYGYWERGDQTADNTFEDMVAALLLDYEWAKREQARRQTAEMVNPVLESLGARVKELA